MEDTKVQWHPGFVAAMNLDIVDMSWKFNKKWALTTKV